MQQPRIFPPSLVLSACTMLACASDLGTGSSATADAGSPNTSPGADASSSSSPSTSDGSTMGPTNAGSDASPGPGNPDSGMASGQLDQDGVLMLYPPDPNGASWHLGSSDPNNVMGLDLNGDTATAGMDGGVHFWTVIGHVVHYSCCPDGRTVRLNIEASGGTQQYTWQNGAIVHGYISNPKDLRDLEATAYVRVHKNLGNHTSMAWKIRGGDHTGSNDPRASCTEMDVPYNSQPEVARELNHPNYDFIKVTPSFNYSVTDGKWLAFKIVSYNLPGGKSTENKVYLDTDPFDANGKPKNNFQPYTEWKDVDGTSSGTYTQAVLWGGWLTTLRIDGWDHLDFAIVSARAILAPSQ